MIHELVPLIIMVLMSLVDDFCIDLVGPVATFATFAGSPPNPSFLSKVLAFVISLRGGKGVCVFLAPLNPGLAREFGGA
jgi:hypothetical protein